MKYTEKYVEDVVDNCDEAFFVLESGRQYNVDDANSLSFEKAPNPSSVSTDYVMVRVNPIRYGGLDEVVFPLDAIEHHVCEADGVDR